MNLLSCPDLIALYNLGLISRDEVRLSLIEWGVMLLPEGGEKPKTKPTSFVEKQAKGGALVRSVLTDEDRAKIDEESQRARETWERNHQ